MKKQDFLNIKTAALRLRAANHKLRQRILELLKDNDRLTVTEIYVKLRLDQSVASQHLAILRKAGLVVTDRKGKNIYYSVDNDELSRVLSLAEKMAAMPL